MGKWSQTSVPSLAGKEMGEKKITARGGVAAYDENLLRCLLIARVFRGRNQGAVDFHGDFHPRR